MRSAACKPICSVLPSFHRGARAIACDARKKGKKGGKKQQDNSFADLLKTRPKLEPWRSTDVVLQNMLMIESYRRAAGKPLLKQRDIAKLTEEVWNAPIALVAHNFSGGKDGFNDAVYTYANKLMLQAFEADDWEDLVGQPSFVTVSEPDEDSVTARAKVMQDMAKRALREDPDDGGVVTSELSGWRRTLKGNRIFVPRFYLWNIKSPQGELVGQAAWFSEFEKEDGTVVQLGPQLPSQEELAAAQAAIDEQASLVRELKEGQGLGNDDPSVQEAVAELLARKDALALKESARDEIRRLEQEGGDSEDEEDNAGWDEVVDPRFEDDVDFAERKKLRVEEQERRAKRERMEKMKSKR